MNRLQPRHQGLPKLLALPIDRDAHYLVKYPRAVRIDSPIIHWPTTHP